jgi:hypothetical protein
MTNPHRPLGIGLAALGVIQTDQLDKGNPDRLIRGGKQLAAMTEYIIITTIPIITIIIILRMCICSRL